jgi:hypothetical protein
MITTTEQPAHFRRNERDDRAERRAHATMDVVDAKRIEHLPQQRAGLRLDVERQRWEQQRRADQSGVPVSELGRAMADGPLYR